MICFQQFNDEINRNETERFSFSLDNWFLQIQFERVFSQIYMHFLLLLSSEFVSNEQLIQFKNIDKNISITKTKKE